MNYTSLTAEIAVFANRNDDYFSDQIPNFIERGIHRIYSEAKSIGFEIVLEKELVANTFKLQKPANWKETVSLAIFDEQKSVFKFLLPRSYEFCKSYWPNQTLTEEPEFYADFNDFNEFFVAPTPAKKYKYQLIYEGIPLFNEANGENFLTRRYPRLLFYACVLETMPFLKDDNRLGQFESLYKSSLANINKDNADLNSDRTLKREEN